MNTYDFSTTDKLYFCGSMFGNEESLLKKLQDGMSSGIETQLHPMEIERQKRLGKRRAKRGMPSSGIGSGSYTSRGSGRYDNSVIIVAGGGGFGTKDDGFFENLLGKFNELAMLNKSYVLIIRGCFDDPSYFSEKKFDFSNVILVKDYSIVRMNGFDILCIGGGVSIDRQWRREQGERLGKKLVFDGCESILDKKLLEEALNNFKVTCIVTNDAPTFMPPSLDTSNSSKWAASDNTIIADMTEQRLRMDGIYSEVVRLNKKPYAWCYFGQNTDNANKINNIRFLSSSCPNTMYNIQEDIRENFGFGLDGEKAITKIKFAKKPVTSNHTARGIGAYDIPAWGIDAMPQEPPQNIGIGDTVEALDGGEPLVANYGADFARTLDEIYRQRIRPTIADIAANTRLALDDDGQVQALRNDVGNAAGIAVDNFGI